MLTLRDSFPFPQTATPRLKRKRRSCSFDDKRASIEEEERPTKARRVNEISSAAYPPPTGVRMPIQTEPIEAIDSITPTAFSQAMRNILIGHDTTIRDPDTSSSSQTRPQPSLDFWLETGDIVLRVEYLIFKIHKNTLAEHSIIFSDMLNLGVPMAGEQVEGVPYVELQDSAGDWIELLKWMYTGLPSYHEDSVIPFSTLKAHLSLSYKYEIPVLQDYSQRSLERMFPRQIVPLYLGSPATLLAATMHAADAIMLSRRYDIPLVLPAAFYLMSCNSSPMQHPDANTLHHLDLGRLETGSDALSQITSSLLTGVPIPASMLPEPTETFQLDLTALCSRCRESWRTSLDKDCRSRSNFSVLRFLVANTINQALSDSQCSNCAVLVNEWRRWHINLIISCIPIWFKF
ncbi:hypothetical protein FRC18_011363 [Serendipita sp. 400]|nr:hypothetical protein FRC18_011363 [Serendipita sp. 400]